MSDLSHAPRDNPRSTRVLKFGGTSVGAPDRLRDAVSIIRKTAARCRPVVVVSAPAGVTDHLVKAADEAPHDRGTAEKRSKEIGGIYRPLAAEILDDETVRRWYRSMLCTRLSSVKEALAARAPCGTAARDALLATGERLMAPLLATALEERGCTARAVDATTLIRTDAAHESAAVRWTSTRQLVRDRAPNWIDSVPVITGFIGGTADGTTTTLGRGGSDYSAALIARALEAERLERWTDVDALYTRDPAVHEDARRLDRLDFDQARSWTKTGRLGMHSRTLDPLIAANVPVHVRCIHRPEASGTRIGPAVPSSHH